MKIHLDTDIGGDLDDVCALAMLLRWPGGLDWTGITTVAEAHGRRAGYVHEVLRLEGRQDIPVAAGADVSQGFYRFAELGYPDEARYWPAPVQPRPNPTEQAIELLRRSLDQGATILAIGPYTNLSLLERKYPGSLRQADIYLMGGYIFPIRPGYPAWPHEYDWNIQVDVASAQHVLQNSQPTLIPMTVTVETALRRAYLERLRRAGALGSLIARQAQEFALDEQNESKYGATCPALPPDIINFQHDPLACAIALGWRDGVEMDEIPLRFEIENGFLREIVDASGRPARVVTRVNARRFDQFWLETVAGAQSLPDRDTGAGE